MLDLATKTSLGLNRHKKRTPGPEGHGGRRCRRCGEGRSRGGRWRLGIDALAVLGRALLFHVVFAALRLLAVGVSGGDAFTTDEAAETVVPAKLAIATVAVASGSAVLALTVPGDNTSVTASHGTLPLVITRGSTGTGQAADRGEDGVVTTVAILATAGGQAQGQTHRAQDCKEPHNVLLFNGFLQSSLSTA